MGCPFYLAVTAAEFYKIAPLPRHTAWMACHFSPYGTGISNCPSCLPQDSMLILNDQIPIDSHDPSRVAEELQGIIEEFSVSRLLLDLQRPGIVQTEKVIGDILKTVSCDVGISHHYITDGCAVFVPPCPLDIPAEKYLQPWQNRKIWLEFTAEPLCLCVTADGCKEKPQLQECNLPEHFDDALFCRYRIQTADDHILFSLYRKPEDIQGYLHRISPLGVECSIGFYQEFGDKKTALRK